MRDDEAHVIAPRDVHFDWTDVPLHYLPGEPVATQFFNFMHLVLPEGERAMAAPPPEAAPLIDDPRLREEVLGFVGQEATHAHSHETAREFLEAQGVPVAPVIERIGAVVDQLLGPRDLPDRVRREWLKERLGVFAAMEHFTAVIGASFLTNDKLDAMHPAMLDLLRWHGAEEVEHRAVVFDAYQYLDGSYARRARTAGVACLALGVTFAATMRHLVRTDPQRTRHPLLGYVSATARGVIPGFDVMARELPKYLRPGFHPHQLGSMDAALAYLATSPAARAAG